MTSVQRLLTIVELDPADDDGPDAQRMTVHVRQDAVLSNGSRVAVLTGRGWSAEMGLVGGKGKPTDAPSIWTLESIKSISRAARDVIGPEEPAKGQSKRDAVDAHWSALAGALAAEGIEIEPAALGKLPHEVELSAPVRERLLG